MKFAIRVLNQFGDDPRAVYDVLSRVFTEVDVHEETIPYLHYYCQVTADGKCEKQVKKMLSNLQSKYSVNKLIRRKGNTDVQLISDEPAYKIYMNKQGGRSYCQIDSEIQKYQLESKEIECQFTD